MRRDPPPEAVLAAARAFGVAGAQLRPLPGATGQTWAAGPDVLRVRPPALLERELAASSAAAAALPVPRVLGVVHLGRMSAALLQRLPGRPAGVLDGVRPERAARRGRACGRVHAALAAVAPPAAIRRADGVAGTADRLLHLDLHPFNILLDDDDEVSGVIDWANAAGGPPELDRARTATLFRWDPAALSLTSDPAWAALVAGWAETGSFSLISRQAMLWACRYMLADLGGRYRAEELAALRRAAGDGPPGP